jgi:hypothetical protein
MISFDHQGRRSKYRVAGPCGHDGYVLPTKAGQDGGYRTLPAERSNLLEDPRTTLRRELREQAGHEARV